VRALRASDVARAREGAAVKKPRARERKPRTWWLVLGPRVTPVGGIAAMVYLSEGVARERCREDWGERLVRVVEQATGRGGKRT